MTRKDYILIADSQLDSLVKDWHEIGRQSFQAAYPNLDYDSEYYLHSWKVRGKYIALDSGHSGMFLIDRTDGSIYAIKGYGVPNKKKLIGNFATVEPMAFYRHRMR